MEFIVIDCRQAPTRNMAGFICVPDGEPRPKSNRADSRDLVCSRCIVGYPEVVEEALHQA